MSDKISVFVSNAMLECPGVRRIPGYIPGSIDPVVVWLKWLRYIPQFQKNKIDSINSMAVSDLSLEDVEFLKYIKRNDELISLFEKFSESKRSTDESKRVQRNMEAEGGLQGIMLSKLTSEELKEAKVRIDKLHQDSKYRDEMVDCMRDVEAYEELSMVDSFIAYCALEMWMKISLAELEAQISDQIQKRSISIL